MWVEELKLDRIKCFEGQPIRFHNKGVPYKWITFLSENGGGKSTALQALALLLAGPESAQKLLPRPLAWLKDETQAGLISVRIHQGDQDTGKFGEDRVTKVFGYSYFVTGNQSVPIRNRTYSEPAVVENIEKRLSWLRQNAFVSNGTGWFAVGYGAFRRLTRSSQIIIPSLEPQARVTNFITQFNEDEPLSAFERWIVYLDYRISKDKDEDAIRMHEMGITAINRLLPEGVSFDRVTEEGRICFHSFGTVVPTTALSDGYRSILALAGDLVWRLITTFPVSPNPLHEEGVVLIDELDIHLHPTWQRNIATWLREQFPNIQFIVATHSPLIAAGAGDDALALKFNIENGASRVETIQNVAAMNVDSLLQSEAFGLASPYSPATEAKINRFDDLVRKGSGRTDGEEREYERLSLFVHDARPFGGAPEPGSLADRVDKYLDKVLK
jgi:hypothetical protein